MWRYGDAGDRWPVQPGEVWAVGPHRLYCGDLEQGVGERVLRDLTTQKAQVLIYCDPPWNAGNARAFRTKAGMEHGPVDFLALMQRIIGLSDQVSQTIYLEMGRQHADVVGGLLAERWRVVTQWPTTYYGSKPAVLLYAGDTLPNTDFTGEDDADTPRLAILASSQPGDIVVDWCTGRGLTAVTAHQEGRIFYGSELHPRRLAVTIEKLTALGLPAQRLRGCVPC